MVTKSELQAELNESEKEKIRREIRDAIAGIRELEQMLTEAEDAVGRQPHWSSRDPIAERMARVGLSKESCAEVTQMFEALEKLDAGETIPPDVQAEFDRQTAAETSALAQLSAIVARHRGG